MSGDGGAGPVEQVPAAWLDGLDAEGARTRWPLDRTPFRIGRRAPAELVLPLPPVSLAPGEPCRKALAIQLSARLHSAQSKVFTPASRHALNMAAAISAALFFE